MLKKLNVSDLKRSPALSPHPNTTQFICCASVIIGKHTGI